MRDIDIRKRYEHYYVEINKKVSWEKILKILSIKYKKNQKGTELIVKCVFHQELTPSLKFSELKGIYNCFGCGNGGTKYKFVEKFLGKEKARMFFKKHFGVRFLYSKKLENDAKMNLLPDWNEIEEVLNEIYLEEEI